MAADRPTLAAQLWGGDVMPLLPVRVRRGMNGGGSGEKRMNERNPWTVTTRYKDLVAFYALLILIFYAFIFTTYPDPTNTPVILRVMMFSALLVFAPLVYAFISFVCLWLIALGGRVVFDRLKEQAEIKRKPWTVTTRFRDLFAFWVLLSLLLCLDKMFWHPLHQTWANDSFFLSFGTVVFTVTIGTMIFAFINWLLLLLTAWWGKVVFDVILSRTKRNPFSRSDETRQHDIEADNTTVVDQSLRTADGVPTFKNMLHEASDHFPHDEELLGEGDAADVADILGERMKLLRYILLIATAISFAVLSWQMGQQYTKWHPDVPWFVWLFWIGLALNFFYLVSNGSKPSSGRISRLIGLWLDAKENELRSRAKRNGPPNPERARTNVPSRRV
jgi:hypothetical protein